MGRSILGIIGAAAIMAGVAMSTHLTYTSYERLSPAIEQRVPAEKLSQQLQKGSEKVSKPLDECNRMKENARDSFNTLKTPPDVVYNKERLWLYDSRGKINERCGFFYPKGEGYMMVSDQRGCKEAVFHVSAHALYNDILKLKSEKISDLHTYLIERNKAIAGDIYFSYFNRRGDVPFIGNKWSAWLIEREMSIRKIYENLKYAVTNGTLNGVKKDQQPKKENGEEFTSTDKILYIAQYSINKDSFDSTGTGTAISDLQRDYFRKFLEALESSAQAVEDRYVYVKLNSEINALKKIYRWARNVSKSNDAHYDKKVEQQFVAMNIHINNALMLLEKSSPAAAHYLREWFFSATLPLLNEEMFVRFVESLMKKKGDGVVDKNSMCLLLNVASEILEKTNSMNDIERAEAAKVVTYIHRVIKHYSSSKSKQVDSEESDIFANARCFENAQSAIIGAEIEELERLHERNMSILSQLPERKTFYMSYLLSLIALLGGGYLAYRSIRKDE